MESVVETKVCRKCGNEKPISEFRIHKERYKDRTYFYRESNCGDCERAYSRQNTAKYNAKNKELISAKYKNKYRTNPAFREAIKEREKIRYLKRKEAIREYGKQYRQSNSVVIAAKKRKYHLLNTYGLTEERYMEMIAEQDGVCAICECDIGDGLFHVDHCHSTGAVRGLLCFSCNAGIGHLKDDVDRLLKAVGYLEQHAKTNHTNEQKTST